MKMKKSVYRKLQWSYIRNNFPSFVFLVFFLLFNAFLFVTRSLEYSRCGWVIMLARANGQCLNFTCSFVLICMLRRSITYLRSIGFSEYLPLDHNVYYHKLTGLFIVFFSIWHTLMHVINFRLLSNITTIPWLDFLFSTYLGLGWIGGCACLTGWILLILLFVLMVPAQALRRSGRFELFYYSHLSYILFIIILIIHSPNYWKWLLFPGLCYIVEYLHRLKSFGSDHGKTYIEKGILLPSKVIHLVIRRPINFDYHPGDYVHVMIPRIANCEWHPFSISSTPEQPDVIWLHIRAVGEWTNHLYEYFEEQKRLSKSFTVNNKLSEVKKLSFTETPKKDDIKDSSEKGKKSNLSRTKMHLNLSRTGSQFGSLYKNISEDSSHKKISNQLSTRSEGAQPTVMLLPIPKDCCELGCSKEAVEICRGRSSSDLQVQSFDQKSFCESSFVNISPQVSSVPKEGILLKDPLKIHLDGPYGSPSAHIFHTEHAILIATGIGATPFTSILQSIMQRYIKSKRKCPKCRFDWTDPIPQSVMKLQKVDFMWLNRDELSFEWFLNLLYDLEMQQLQLMEYERFLDIHLYLTSAKTVNSIRQKSTFYSPVVSRSKPKLKTRPGRPNWDKFFTQMANENKGKVTVFFCGPAKLARTLHHYSNIFGFKFRKETF